MSTLKADTIQSTSGGAATLTKQSAAKAFIDKSQDGTSISKSLNISSLDDDGTGDFGIHFTSSMDSANYSIAQCCDDRAASTSILHVESSNGTYASGSVDFESNYVSATENRTAYDVKAGVVIHGDLA
jgi:hypothetical protein